ncbi:hypothetical protein [Flavobacterium aquatile]|uniref:hypothetical protein n=1 Tax=Flavobacterium aquatile TaxID=245 RepID=UPI00116A9B50|nr:hypothetical protein [Flavobacterium aquatile]GEC79095.1 hypothetical protein FAQ01_19650 [Flavobacterium aquatile]
MLISVLLHGTIKSLKHRKNMFSSLFHGIEIGGIITTQNGFRTLTIEEREQQKSKKQP